MDTAAIIYIAMSGDMDSGTSIHVIIKPHHLHLLTDIIIKTNLVQIDIYMDQKGNFETLRTLRCSLPSLILKNVWTIGLICIVNSGVYCSKT